MVLNFEFERLEAELKVRNPKKVLVQLPEGVKQDVTMIQEKIENLGIEVVFSGETAWGGCCVNSDEARNVEADLIVHFGHAKYSDVDFPVLYIEVKDDVKLDSLLEKSLESLNDYKKIGLSFSIQHKDEIDSVRKFYERNGKEILMSEKVGHAVVLGHVIGCEFSGLKTIQENVDAFVVIGNNFHSMGAALSVDKPVFLLDVYNEDVKEMRDLRDKILRQRIISISKFKDVKNVGVIIESKFGQKFGDANLLIDGLKEDGKVPHLITMSEITPDKIMNFYNLDAFVVLACPRIPIDDFAKYEKPMITFREALVVVGKKSMDDLLEEGIL